MVHVGDTAAIIAVAQQSGLPGHVGRAVLAAYNCGRADIAYRVLKEYKAGSDRGAGGGDVELFPSRFGSCVFVLYITLLFTVSLADT